MGGRLYDWIGAGDSADLPAAGSMAALLGGAGSTAFFFETDTKVLEVYDESGPSWFGIDAAALAAIAFATLPDVDWSTPPTDGQIFAWDFGASKLAPITLLYNTAEDLQDAVGPMFHNGAGITASYNDGTGQIDIDCTITQYTDEMAQDALANAFAAGTHVGIAVNYNDLSNKFDLVVDSAYITAGAVTAIAAASIADLADVHSLAGIANNDTLLWNAANSRFEKGAAAGYTDEQARDAIAAMLAAGTHTGITVTNNDAGDSMALAGSWVLVDSFTFTGAEATKTLTAPAGYFDLLIVCNVRSDRAGQAQSTVGFRFNGDTTAANYATQTINSAGSTINCGQNLSGALSYMLAQAIPAATATAGYGGVIQHTVIDYTNTVLHKMVTGEVFITGVNSAAAATKHQSGGHWFSTAAVTSVTLFDVNSANFTAGSTFRLYARK